MTAWLAVVCRRSRVCTLRSHCDATSRFLYCRPEAAQRFGTCSRKCAAGAAAQAPLGLKAGCTTALIARRVERSGSAIRTPFGAWFTYPTHQRRQLSARPAKWKQIRAIPRNPFRPAVFGPLGAEPSFFRRPEAACGALRRQGRETQELPYRKRFSGPPATLIYAGMSGSKTVPKGSLDARFLRAVEAWCAGNGMSTGAFGAAVYRDRGFVASLRGGRSPRLGTVDRALAVMGEPPAGLAFLREVDVFLAVTGVKRSLLGREATGNPSFVSQLLRGVSPKLATVEAVRASMKWHASPAEWREIRARAGTLPAILTGAPLPSPEPHARSEDRDTGPGRPARRFTGRVHVDTREAAERLGLSPGTLARYRITGAGPCYYRFGGCVRYTETDLEAWTAARRERRNGGVRAGDEAGRRISP